jgi:hypothetical protein
MVVNSQGLGFAVSLDGFDRAVNIPSNEHATAEVFDSKGSFFHVLWGMAAGFMPSEWSVLSTTVFGAYELSKVEGGKPFAKVSGALLEFALGMGIAGLIIWGRK